MREQWLPALSALALEVSAPGVVTRSADDVGRLLDLPTSIVWDLIEERELHPVVRGGRRERYRFTSRELLRFVLHDGFESPRVAELEHRLGEAHAQIARMKKARPSGRVLPTMRRAVLARDGRRCRYCGRQIGPRSVLHLDHVIPVSRGGADTLENLVVACEGCNRRKGARLLSETRMTLLPAPAVGQFVGQGQEAVRA